MHPGLRNWRKRESSSYWRQLYFCISEASAVILLVIIPGTDIILPNQSCLAVCEWSAIGYMVTFIHRGIFGLFIMAMLLLPSPHPVYPSCASRECTNLGILGQGNVYQSDVIFSPAHDTRMTHDNQRGSHLFDCTAAVMLLSCCQLTDVTVCMSPCYPVMLSCCHAVTSLPHVTRQWRS